MQIVIICVYSVYLSSYIAGLGSAVVLVQVALICKHKSNFRGTFITKHDFHNGSMIVVRESV